jgi:hypothetical protein
MTTCNVVKKLALGVALSGLFAWQASATMAYNYPSGLVGNQPDGPWSLGNVFTVNTPITVNALGAFEPVNGFSSQGVSVAIYSINLDGTALTGGSLVTSVADFTGTPTPLAGSTAVQNITPVTLQDGTYMVVANNYGSGMSVDYNQFWQKTGASLISANLGSAVTFSSNGYAETTRGLGGSIDNGWFYDPSGPGINGGYGQPIDTTPRYAAGNFEYTFTPVPEAAGFTLAGVGLLGLVYVGRCYRLKLKPA